MSSIQREVKSLLGTDASDGENVVSRRHVRSIEQISKDTDRDNFMSAIHHDHEHRMSKRDITHNINFFMNVPVTPEGGLTFEDGISAPGKYVEMRAEMDVICLISNCPQLNNPCNAYNPTPIRLLIWNQ